MSKTGLFINHQAQPGKRDEVQKVWDQYVRPRVEANAAHEAYYFCHDQNDPDAICVFQLYSDPEAMRNFLSGEWYAGYLKEVSKFVAAPPVIRPASLVWSKKQDA